MTVLGTVKFCCTSYAWHDIYEINVMHVRTQQNYINDIIAYRGYVYLNYIYEQLGVKWDTEDENVCIKDGYQIVLEITEVLSDNSLVINICRC